nr:substrate-binding domain-containing protein [Succinivibrionaceae bacterium]
RAAALALALAALPTVAPAAPRTVNAFYHDLGDTFVSHIAGAVERSAIEARGFEFFTYDAQGDPEAEGRNFRDALASHPGPMLVVTHDPGTAALASDAAIRAGVPVVFLNRDPGDAVLSANPQSWYIGFQPRLAGIYQAQLLLRHLKDHPGWDLNGNGRLDYVLLMGERDNPDTIARSDAFEKAMLATGQQMGRVDAAYCDWDGARASEALGRMVERHGIAPQGAIEAVVSNNDVMALAALGVLRRHGYNGGDPARCLPVLGVDAIHNALLEVRSGAMAGTVFQDAALYGTTAIRLVSQLLDNRSGRYDEPIDEESLGLPVGDDRRILTPYVPIDSGRAQRLLDAGR